MSTLILAGSKSSMEEKVLSRISLHFRTGEIKRVNPASLIINQSLLFRLYKKQPNPNLHWHSLQQYHW
jgi:hypothetical protein